MILNFQKNVWLLSCGLLNRSSPLVITCFTYKIKLSLFAVVETSLKVAGLQLHWISNPFYKVDLDCQLHKYL